MYVTPEHIAAAGKANVESLIGLAHTQFATLQRLSALNFSLAKSAFEGSVSYTKSLLGAKDPQEFASLSAAAAQPAIENVIAYSRSVYEIVTQTNADTKNFAEAQAGEFNKSIVGFLDKASTNAPAGSEAVIAAVRSALAATNSAYERMSSATKQASDIAESKFMDATTAVLNSAKKKAA
jgi:phasin family protein